MENRLMERWPLAGPGAAETAALHTKHAENTRTVARF